MRFEKSVYDVGQGAGRSVPDYAANERTQALAVAQQGMAQRAQASLDRQRQQLAAQQFSEQLSLERARMAQDQGRFMAQQQAGQQQFGMELEDRAKARALQETLAQLGFQDSALGRQHQSGMQQSDFAFRGQENEENRAFQQQLHQSGLADKALDRKQSADQFGATMGFQQEGRGFDQAMSQSQFGLQREQFGFERNQALQAQAEQRRARIYESTKDYVAKLSTGNTLSSEDLGAVRNLIRHSDPETARGIAQTLNAAALNEAQFKGLNSITTPIVGLLSEFGITTDPIVAVTRDQAARMGLQSQALRQAARPGQAGYAPPQLPIDSFVQQAGRQAVGPRFEIDPSSGVQHSFQTPYNVTPGPYTVGGGAPDPTQLFQQAAQARAHAMQGQGVGESQMVQLARFLQDFSPPQAAQRAAQQAVLEQVLQELSDEQFSTPNSRTVSPRPQQFGPYR